MAAFHNDSRFTFDKAEPFAIEARSHGRGKSQQAGPRNMIDRSSIFMFDRRHQLMFWSGDHSRYGFDFTKNRLSLASCIGSCESLHILCTNCSFMDFELHSFYFFIFLTP